MTSVRGGTGKSTITALLAWIVQRHRDDRVVAVDSAPGPGTLTRRLGVTGRGSIRHLAAARPSSWSDLSTHLARTPDGLFVVPAGNASVGDELEDETFQRGAGRLSRYFSATFIDCGGGLDTKLRRGILMGAHAQVFVVPATLDGAHSARAAMQWFGVNGFGHLLPHTVVALVAHTSKTDIDRGRAVEMLSASAVPVVHVPFDRHLAADGPMDLGRVSAPAYSALVQIACASFARALNAT